MRAGEFFVPPFLCFLPIGAYCIPPICFGLAVGRPVFINTFFCVFAYQKKKKKRKEKRMLFSLLHAFNNSSI